MKDELEKMIDNIAASAAQEPENFTDTATGLLICGKCHTPSNAA